MPRKIGEGNPEAQINMSDDTKRSATLAADYKDLKRKLYGERPQYREFKDKEVTGHVIGQNSGFETLGVHLVQHPELIDNPAPLSAENTVEGTDRMIKDQLVHLENVQEAVREGVNGHTSFESRLALGASQEWQFPNFREQTVQDILRQIADKIEAKFGRGVTPARRIEIGVDKIDKIVKAMNKQRISDIPMEQLAELVLEEGTVRGFANGEIYKLNTDGFQFYEDLGIKLGDYQINGFMKHFEGLKKGKKISEEKFEEMKNRLEALRG